MTEKSIAKSEKIIHTHFNPFHVKTTFFDQKIRTLFSRFDFDHNGKIDKHDFEVWADILFQKGCSSLTFQNFLHDINLFFVSSKGELSSETIENKKQILDKIWNVYFLPADINCNGSIDYLEFYHHMKAVSILNR